MHTLEEIYIFGSKWLIRYVDSIILENGDSCHGTCDHDNKIITVTKTDNTRLFIGTIFHEIMHAALSECGVGCSGAEIINEKQEELMCYIFENLLTTSHEAFEVIFNDYKHRKNIKEQVQNSISEVLSKS